jgi:hypothetical protein
LGPLFNEGLQKLAAHSLTLRKKWNQLGWRAERALGGGMPNNVEKDKPIRIHPIVSQLVDPAVLEKMKVRPVGEAEGKVESKGQGKQQGT